MSSAMESINIEKILVQDSQSLYENIHYKGC